MEAALSKKEYYIMSDYKEYTTDDIEAMPEGERAELIDGELFMMSSPSVTHQAILTWLLVDIFSKIREKKGKCKAFAAPFAVYVKDDKRNYVEPDIVVICERDKLDDKGCHGAPDWVIEIVSPSNKKMDYYKKLALYAEAGVREYWIIDPMRKAIIVHCLEEGAIPQIYTFSDSIKCSILEDFEIDFSEMSDYEYVSEDDA